VTPPRFVCTCALALSCVCATVAEEDLSQRQNVQKLRVKELRAILARRGVKCMGCAEKHEYVERVLATKELEPKDEGPKGEYCAAKSINLVFMNPSVKARVVFDSKTQSLSFSLTGDLNVESCDGTRYKYDAESDELASVQPAGCLQQIFDRYGQDEAKVHLKWLRSSDKVQAEVRGITLIGTVSVALSKDACDGSYTGEDIMGGMAARALKDAHGSDLPTPDEL